MELLTKLITMQITITATLTEEQIYVLAKQKWYNTTLVTYNPKEDGTFDIVETKNPTSMADFVKNVYEWVIKNDATSVFVEYARQQKEEQRIAEENAIRENVNNAITSETK